MVVISAQQTVDFLSLDLQPAAEEWASITASWAEKCDVNTTSVIDQINIRRI
jgi:hypothetical protein